MALIGVRYLVRWVLGKPAPERPLLPARWIWVILIAIVMFWFLRNIPVYPFTLLAPTEL